MVWQKVEARCVFGPSTFIKLDGDEWTEINPDEDDGFRGQGTGFPFMNERCLLVRVQTHTHDEGDTL